MYLRVLARYSHGAKHVVDKQPSNAVIVGMIHAAFPNARILYLNRKPADNAISIWTTYMHTGVPFVHSKANIVHGLRGHLLHMEYWKQTLPPDRLLEIPYESL